MENIKYHPKETGGIRNRRINGKFLRGPIPLGWLEAASKLKGKSLNVGIAVWFLAGVNDSYMIRLSGKTLRRLGIKRTTGYRALKHLEAAGLVSVNRGRGRNPLVTINIDFEKKEVGDEVQQ